MTGIPDTTQRWVTAQAERAAAQAGGDPRVLSAIIDMFTATARAAQAGRVAAGKEVWK